MTDMSLATPLNPLRFLHRRQSTIGYLHTKQLAFYQRTTTQPQVDVVGVEDVVTYSRDGSISTMLYWVLKRS